jgi:hypothetical protein
MVEDLEAVVLEEEVLEVVSVAVEVVEVVRQEDFEKRIILV